VNRDPIESGETPPAALPPRKSWGTIVAPALFSTALGAIAVFGGHRLAGSAVIDLGPTDARYVHGFREIERDGATYFRWSSVPSSQIVAPLRFCGPGSLRLRARRHFEDPALLTVALNGTVLGQRAVRALVDRPYEILEFQVPKITCTSNASILLEAIVTNNRPLGVAIDWAEIRSETGFFPHSDAVVAGALFAGLATAALSLAGGGSAMAFGVGTTLAALAAFACVWLPIAAERILRGGTLALIVLLLLVAVLSRQSIWQALSIRNRQLILAITIATLVSRAAFLHPQVFYPDYRVHALVQQTFSRLGLTAFLDQLFEIQYARSLGLQQIEGEWYPFPYPPGFYVLAEAVSKGLGLDSLDAVQVSAVISASLLPILTAALGLSLGLGEGTCVAAAFFVAFQPLLLRRMALGYFPGLAGQVFDALGLLVLIGAVRQIRDRGRSLVLLGLTLVVAFLVYTQSIANFGLLIAVLLLVALVRRAPSSGSVVRVAVVAFVALLASIAIFYARYVPVFQNVASHQPQPESVLLERLDQIRQAQNRIAMVEDDDSSDPYSGPTTNLTRGFLRLGSRLWRFYGPFVFTLVLGAWALWRELDPSSRSLALAWSSVALSISLLAAGLASPNGFQHLKDLEFTAPLAGLALGSLAAAAATSRPVLAKGFVGAWCAFAAYALAVEFGDRLLPLAGF
jgi:hypothetical protein